MTERFDQAAGLDSELYVRAQERLLELKSQLGRSSVEDLAWEVIRRLRAVEPPAVYDYPAPDQIEHLCHALLSDDQLAGAQFIKDAQNAGASVDAVYLNYLAPAARLLGDWWNDDLVTFVDVTLGTSRMYAIMRALRLKSKVIIKDNAKSAVFMSVPGDTHTLGVSMATDLFRKAGWSIDLIVGKPHDDLIEDIAQSDAAIIGISAGGEHSLTALARLVIALRLIKPHAFIVISGNMVDEMRGSVDLMDVDGIVSDVSLAQQLMDGLWEQIQQSSQASKSFP